MINVDNDREENDMIYKSVQKGQRKEVKSPCCKINMINHNLKMKQRGIRL